MQGERDYYSVAEAAAILGMTPARVLQMLTAGELEGLPPGATTEGTWKVLLPVTPTAEPAADQAQHQDESTEDHARLPEALEEATDVAEEQPEAAAEEDLPRGDSAANIREPTAPSGWVSTQQAARALGISPRTVRWHIEQGNLEAKPEGEGVKRAWLVSIDSLQEFRDARHTTADQPRASRISNQGGDIAAESPGSAIRELADRLAEEAARAAEFRVRLELTEQAASSVREELAEERRRRAEAEQERDNLRRRLEAHEMNALRRASRPSESVAEGSRDSPVDLGSSPTPRDAGEGLQTARARPWWRFWG